ncbi:hypothetical protein D3C72_1858520 [compost metagenome]
MATEGLERIALKGARHLVIRHVETVQQWLQPRRPVLERGDTYIGEAVEHAMANQRGERVGNGPPHPVEKLAEWVLLEGTEFTFATSGPPLIDLVIAGVGHMHDNEDLRFVDASPEGVEFLEGH